MKIVELILDDQQLATGIDAVSLVEEPAIESNFVALKNHRVEFKTIDQEKRILMGPALIPNKPIYRNQVFNGEQMEFYVYFSKSTIVKASQLFLMKGAQNKATLEHQININGLSVVESWIKEDEIHDKSAIYGLTDPVGTWMIAMKVNNQEIWDDYVKTGKVKGFSIEGYFADKSIIKEETLIEQKKAVRSPEIIVNELKSILMEYQKSNNQN